GQRLPSSGLRERSPAGDSTYRRGRRTDPPRTVTPRLDRVANHGNTISGYCPMSVEVHTDVAPSFPTRAADEAQSFKIQRRHARRLKLFDPVTVRTATWQSFALLHTR